MTSSEDFPDFDLDNGLDLPNFHRNRWLAWRTRRAMHRGVRNAVQELAPLGVVRAEPFLGYHVEPVVWLVTQSDAERDELRRHLRTTTRVVKRCLREAGVRADLVVRSGIEVQSEETVRRDHDGNWYYAMK